MEGQSSEGLGCTRRHGHYFKGHAQKYSLPAKTSLRKLPTRLSPLPSLTVYLLGKRWRSQVGSIGKV